MRELQNWFIYFFSGWLAPCFPQRSHAHAAFADLHPEWLSKNWQQTQRVLLHLCIRGFTSTGWSWKCLHSCMLLGMNATNARDRQLQWGAGAARMLPTFAKRPARTGKRSPKTRRYKRRRRASSSAQKRLAQRDVKMYALGSLKLCTACGTVLTQCSSSAFVLNFVDLAGQFKVWALALIAPAKKNAEVKIYKTCSLSLVRLEIGPSCLGSGRTALHKSSQASAGLKRSLLQLMK